MEGKRCVRWRHCKSGTQKGFLASRAGSLHGGKNDASKAHALLVCLSPYLCLPACASQACPWRCAGGVPLSLHVDSVRWSLFTSVSLLIFSTTPTTLARPHTRHRQHETPSNNAHPYTTTRRRQRLSLFPSASSGPPPRPSLPGQRPVCDPGPACRRPGGSNDGGGQRDDECRRGMLCPCPSCPLSHKHSTHVYLKCLNSRWWPPRCAVGLAVGISPTLSGRRLTAASF